MRINKKHKHFSYEARCVFQSSKGTLTPDKVRTAVARVDDYAAKLTAFTEETNKWPTMDPPPSQGFMEDHERRCEQVQRKFRTLIALPEVKAVLVARQKAAERRS